MADPARHHPRVVRLLTGDRQSLSATATALRCDSTGRWVRLREMSLISDQFRPIT